MTVNLKRKITDSLLKKAISRKTIRGTSPGNSQKAMYSTKVASKWIKRGKKNAAACSKILVRVDLEQPGSNNLNTLMLNSHM